VGQALQEGTEEVRALGISQNMHGLMLECAGDILVVEEIRCNGCSVMPLFMRARREHLQHYLRGHLACVLGQYAHTLCISDRPGTNDGHARYVLQVGNCVTGVTMQVAFDMTGSCLPRHLYSRQIATVKTMDLPRIGLKTSVVLDTFRLDTGELFSLAPGDVLLSKLCLPSDQRVTLKVGGLINTISGRARLEKHCIQFCFTPPLQTERNVVTNSYDIEKNDALDLSAPFAHEEELGAIAPVDSGTPNDISPIAAASYWRLHCVLEGPVVQLSELMSMRPGNVLQLTQQTNCVEVDLCLDSQAVARGQVIDVEGKLGIRILKSYLPARTTTLA
jgi:flagellar motor switch/type III secretory pathway protein FliN